MFIYVEECTCDVFDKPYPASITKKELTNVKIQEQTAYLTQMLRNYPYYSIDVPWIKSSLFVQSCIPISLLQKELSNNLEEIGEIK